MDHQKKKKKKKKTSLVSRGFWKHSYTAYRKIYSAAAQIWRDVYMLAVKKKKKNFFFSAYDNSVTQSI